MTVTGEDIAAFVGRSGDGPFATLADAAVAVITSMARAYTRGRGFTNGEPNDEIAAVITTASARLVANPEQLLGTVGSIDTRSSFTGWSLAETFVLNRYRMRAL